MPKTVHITSKKIAYVLLGAIAFLLIANLSIIYLRFVRGFQHLRGFIHGFYFDAEANFPSLYSALAILVSAYLLWLISNLDREKSAKRSFYWKLLSVVFVLLAMDEFGSLHEYMIEPLRGILDKSSLDSDYLYFAWFIPYVILVLVLCIVLLRFFLGLPRRTRWLFLIAIVLFLSGAVGMEMIGGNYWANQGWAIDGSDDADLYYALIITVEELLEMLGIVVFIYALSEYYLKNGNEQARLLVFSDTMKESAQSPSNSGQQKSR